MARWIFASVSISLSAPSPRSSRHCLDEHQDVVDVDLDLLDQLDLEDDVVVDRLLLGVRCACGTRRRG